MEKVVEELISMSVGIQDKTEIAQVERLHLITIGCGNIIADAMEKVGKDGVITVEEVKA